MAVSIHDIVGRYSHVRSATEADNAEILSFLKTVDMKTPGLSLRYDRDPDFFAFLRLQAEKAFTFLFLNDDGSIGGLTVVSIRRHFVNWRVVRAGYLSDLRLHPRLSRRARVQWRQVYGEVVSCFRDIIEFDGCEYLYSAILEKNEAANTAMTKGKSGFVYHELARYEAVTVLGRWPFGPLRRLLPGGKPSGVRIRRGEPSDAAALRTFLHHETSQRTLGDFVAATHQDDEFERRLKNWEGFSHSTFLIAENAAGAIVGCLAPWAQSSARKFVVNGIDFRNRLLGRVLPLLGGKTLSEQQEFSVLNLAHLEIASSLSDEVRLKVFRALLDALFSLGMNRGFHVVQFLNFSSSSLLPGLRFGGYLLHRTPGILYQVMSSQEVEEKHFLPLVAGRELRFEVGIA